MRRLPLALLGVTVTAAVGLLLYLLRSSPAPDPRPPTPDRRAEEPDPGSRLAAPGSRLPVIPTLPTDENPATLSVRSEVLRTLDRLAAPIAIQTVTCPTPASCDVTLSAKSREDAAILIDRLSEPQSGLALDHKSMKLHALRDDPDTGLVVFGFTLER